MQFIPIPSTLTLILTLVLFGL